MNINIIGSPRTGSTYLQSCFNRLIYARVGEVQTAGEILAPFKQEYIQYSHEERKELYKELSESIKPHIFKILPYQLHPTKFSQDQWVDELLYFTNMPDTFNVFLYRENILEQFMSFLINIKTSINVIKEDSLTDTIGKVNIDSEEIKKNARKFVDQIRRSIITYKATKYDTILRYEDFIGTPTLDFKKYLTGREPAFFDQGNYPRKLTTLEHKKKILPYQEIKEALLNELQNRNVPLELPFTPTGLNSLDFLEQFEK